MERISERAILRILSAEGEDPSLDSNQRPPIITVSTVKSFWGNEQVSNMTPKIGFCSDGGMRKPKAS